jgi:exopolysaccharide production protein ExoQ
LFVALFPDSVLELAGKDPTLTGRTELWDLVIDKIYERPLFGWGYSAFWEMANPLAVEISAKVRWLVPHAHNGLLEMLLEVGVVGALLIITIFLRGAWLGWRCLRTPNRELGLSLLLCCGAILITGTTESVLVDFSGAWTIIFFVLSFMAERSIGALSSNRVLRRQLPVPTTVYKRA